MPDSLGISLAFSHADEATAAGLQRPAARRGLEDRPPTSSRPPLPRARRGPDEPPADPATLAALRPPAALDKNENSYGVPHAVRRAAAHASPSAVVGNMHRYPSPQLVDDLVCRLAALHLGLSPTQFLVGSGSTELLNRCMQRFVDQRAAGRVLMAKPAYRGISDAARDHRVDVVEVPLRGDTTTLQYDFPEMVRRAHDPSCNVHLVVLDNPNNPTGLYAPLSQVRNFLHQLPTAVTVVVDQAYQEYVVDDDAVSCREMLQDHPRLLLLRTFSKAWGLADARVGYGMAHFALIDELRGERLPIDIPSSLSLRSASQALDDADWCRRVREHNDRQRRRLQGELTRRGLWCTPSQGSFLSVHVGGDATSLARALASRGVMTRPSTDYGLSQHLRITVGTAQENSQLLATLDAIL